MPPESRAQLLQYLSVTLYYPLVREPENRLRLMQLAEALRYELRLA